MVGHPHILPPNRAAAFLTEMLPVLPGPVDGKISHDRFRIEDVEWAPKVHVKAAEADAWALDVEFATRSGRRADTNALLSAWRSGTGLVPLMDGGFAPLPEGWLEQYGSVLRELWEERNERGEVSRFCAPALAELLGDRVLPLADDVPATQPPLVAVIVKADRVKATTPMVYVQCRHQPSPVESATRTMSSPEAVPDQPLSSGEGSGHASSPACPPGGGGGGGGHALMYTSGSP